ncbi:hypothetical protein HMPREF1868_00669 [Olsenella sp. DNF00959]|nr:hypothetical protein HMPREF1868_00669 [Olsenella sp. DNF00959]
MYSLVKRRCEAQRAEGPSPMKLRQPASGHGAKSRQAKGLEDGGARASNSDVPSIGTGAAMAPQRCAGTGKGR